MHFNKAASVRVTENKVGIWGFKMMRWACLPTRNEMVNFLLLWATKWCNNRFGQPTQPMSTPQNAYDYSA